MTAATPRTSFLPVLTMLFALLAMPSSFAAAAAPEESTDLAGDAIRLAQANPPNRKFVDGVMTTIPMKFSAQDTYTSPQQYRDILEGIPNLDWTPNYLSETRTLKSMASNVIFRRDIWGLEFSFKPVRMIEVGVPQPSGKLQKKLVWYMVYKVTNTGNPLRHVPVKDQYDNVKFEVQQIDDLPSAPIRFFPRFVLESKDTKQKKEYLDRIIPAAIEKIAERETGGSKLYNSVEISRFDIPVSTPEKDNSIWGVVTWEDVDPDTDFFSIYIDGLTNAFSFEDADENYDASSNPLSYRQYKQKTLKLNFWRPGDRLDENEREIRLGSPGEVDYEWIFR
ncbi:hypothetical protein [Bremerella alba]|uniref:Uncharacterized protein n=1 Tax=Bremerella alba TaxID=980252 RepID=A0A7V8V2A7_9BACT|nr:hypothetical protein [Bremerella alba]MBA2113319.1 hypothetical protein [Bremerella alba]